MITVREIFSILNDIAPFSLSEEWDNCGLQAGNLSWSVKKILVSLDISIEVMKHAASSQIDLVISHHPLMIRPPKNIDFSIMPGAAIEIAAEKKISILSAHTNLDKANGGLNDYFCYILGIKNLKPLTSLYNPSQNSSNSINIVCKENGLGRTGEIETAMLLKEFAVYVKNKLQLPAIRLTGNPERNVKRIAACTGSGGSLLKDFFDSKAEVFVTGDIKYHEARQIEEAGLGLIDVGHFASERIVVDYLCEKLNYIFNEQCIDVEVEGFYSDSDPFTTLI